MPPKKPTKAPSRTGRPPKVVDLDAIREKARLGQWKPAYLARILGIPKSTLMGPKHRAEVTEAIEDGRALFEMEALEQYDRACRGGKVDKAAFALVIFKMKQIGWSDRQHGPGGGGQVELELDGADERFLDLVERFMSKQDSEGATA